MRVRVLALMQVLMQAQAQAQAQVQVQVLMQALMQAQAHWPGPLGWADRGPTERAVGRLGSVVGW